MSLELRDIEKGSIMKFALDVRFHLVFWIVMQIYYFYAMNLFEVPFDRSLQSKIFFLPFQLIAAYFMIFILLGRYLYKGKYIKAIVGFIVFIFTFSYMVSNINTYVVNPYFNDDYVQPRLISILLDIENLIANYMRVIFLTPLILVCLEFGVAQFQKMEEVEELLTQKNNAELDLLKTQIHPHFLLSTLRNLEELTKIKDEDGPIVIERLAETLDYILYKGRQEKIDLKSELEAIIDYVALENIRFKNRTAINLDIGNLDNSRTISPLILFSFLEFNFEGYDRRNFPFSSCIITIREDQNLLLCSIMNTRINGENESQFKFEYEKMKRQLDISYPNQYELEIKDSKDFFLINLEIEL